MKETKPAGERPIGGQRPEGAGAAPRRAASRPWEGVARISGKVGQWTTHRMLCCEVLPGITIP